MTKNKFCDIKDLTGEPDVEMWFINRLLTHLSYLPEDIKLKKSLKEYKIGQGSKSSLYKPDYVIFSNNFPSLVIDAKSPTENIEDWVQQCSSYCLEINKLYIHNPVEYYLLTNGKKTALYKWDLKEPIVTLNFEDFIEGNQKFLKLEEYIQKENLSKLSRKKHKELMEGDFNFKPISLEEISTLFAKIHKFIRNSEKKTASPAFKELVKIIFIKIKKDRELHEKLGNSQPKVKDVIFSVAWIKNQTENDNPINDPLFKNLLKDLEKEIRDKKKKRIFDIDEEINLSPTTIEKIVEDLEKIDFYKMEEDIHGRMFENFLDATVRGKELGQYFTPRDIVKLMVDLADTNVTKTDCESVLDACCGSGGFLITAMNDMFKKAESMVGLSNRELKDLKGTIANKSLTGIDAGSDPPIHRIARMNMHLHGDGGSRIYFADSLDKRIGQVGKPNLELDGEISELRKMLIDDKTTFDVILSNPPFSMMYSPENQEQREILNQYSISNSKNGSSSLLSSIMFLERYNDLVSDNGRILAIIDDSILSGDSYKSIRDKIREIFIIRGVISLPGDAFKRADARVKTSILILRKKLKGERQSDVFMEKSIYLGLTPKTAKRIGITRRELETERIEEINQIVQEYKKFCAGKECNYIVSAEKITDRLDVKYCLNENSRRKRIWISKGCDVVKLSKVLFEVKGRDEKVDEDKEYTLLKVTYGGEVLEAESGYGEDVSYSRLYKVKPWDILFSNMGVGRGAIGIVPKQFDGKYVSNEYTILSANSNEAAVFYSNLLRTKEILGDILSSTTGMNRGRIKWGEMSTIDVPRYNESQHHMKDIVKALNTVWKTYSKYNQSREQQMHNLIIDLKLDEEDSRKRWLAYKPPE